MAYERFQTDTGEEYGSFEVFYLKASTEEGSERDAGWYWWACFPGCLPDGELTGPFKTEAEARTDALDAF